MLSRASRSRQTSRGANKGTDFLGRGCASARRPVPRTEQEEDAMKRQYEDYRVLASRPIVLPGRPRSRASQKGAFSHGNASTTLGAGLIERNEQHRERARNGGRTWPRPAIVSHCAWRPRDFRPNDIHVESRDPDLTAITERKPVTDSRLGRHFD